MIYIKSTHTIEQEGALYRYCKIIIGQNDTAYNWIVGGLPVDGDLQAILDARFAELWQAAQSGESVDFWAFALAYLDTWRIKLRVGFGLTEAAYYEALRWQSDPSSQLALNPGRLSAEVYAAQVVSRWDKIERDYNLGVSLVNQAGDVDTVAIILSRRG